MGATAGFVAMAGFSLYQAHEQAEAQRAQADFTARQFEQNQKLADIEATDAIRRGDRNASLAGVQARQHIGAQRAAAAASGVDANFGSALDIQADTAEMGAMNQVTIKNNAWREAWGYKIQALNASSSAGFARMAGDNQSRNTLLTGGMNAISYGSRAYGSSRTIGDYRTNNTSAPGMEG